MNFDPKLFLIILDQRENIELLLSGIPKNAKIWCFPCHFEIQQVCVCCKTAITLSCQHCVTDIYGLVSGIVRGSLNYL